MQKINPADIAPPLGLYTHGVLVPAHYESLQIAGQVGCDAAGVVPQDIEAQTENCWRNLLAVLRAAGMGMENVVKITTYLTDPADLAAFAKVRSAFLGEARPASTLLIVKALARPEWRVEIDAVAAREIRSV